MSMLPRPTSKGFVRISPEQIVQIIVALDNRQRSHRHGKDDLVGTRAELDIRPEERLEIRRWRGAPVSDPKMERCQPVVRDLPADAHHRHQPELDLMAVRVPVDVDVIESNRGRAIILAEMQADALVYDSAISLGVANRIHEPLGRRDHIVNQPNFAQVEIAAQVKSKEFVPKFFGSEVQNPNLLGHLKTYGVIISLLGGSPCLGENGPRIFAELAQACTSQAGNSAGGGWYGAKPVSLAGAHESRCRLIPRSLQRLWRRNQPEDRRAHKTLWLERLCKPAACATR